MSDESKNKFRPCKIWNELTNRRIETLNRLYNFRRYLPPNRCRDSKLPAGARSHVIGRSFTNYPPPEQLSRESLVIKEPHRPHPRAEARRPLGETQEILVAEGGRNCQKFKNQAWSSTRILPQAHHDEGYLCILVKATIPTAR